MFANWFRSLVVAAGVLTGVAVAGSDAKAQYYAPGGYGHHYHGGYGYGYRPHYGYVPGGYYRPVAVPVPVPVGGYVAPVVGPVYQPAGASVFVSPGAGIGFSYSSGGYVRPWGW